MKTGDTISYVPKINYKAPKGRTSFGAKYISELLNYAEQFNELMFTDEQGQLWKLSKVKGKI